MKNQNNQNNQTNKESIIAIIYNHNNITKEVYSDSLNEYQKSVDHIAKCKSNYRYVSDPSIKETTSYMNTDISPENVQIKEETVEIVKETYYERRNNSIKIQENKVRREKFVFNEAELKVRYIKLHIQSPDQTQQYRYLKVVKPKFIGCYIQSNMLPVREKKKGEQRKQPAGRIILRGQTFLLKENNVDEPLDCMIGKNDKNPYSQTRLFTTVYIPVNEFSSLEDMEKDISRTKGRLNKTEMKQLLSELQG